MCLKKTKKKNITWQWVNNDTFLFGWTIALLSRSLFVNAHKLSHSTSPSVTAGSWPCHSFPQRLFQPWSPKRALAIPLASNCTATIHENRWRFHCFHALWVELEAKFCDGRDLCEKASNSRPKPSSLSSRTREGHRDRLETNLHWSAHPSVVYGVYLLRVSTANQL